MYETKCKPQKTQLAKLAKLRSFILTFTLLLRLL